MSDTTPEAETETTSGATPGAEGNDSVWPFFAIYAVMWAGMIGTSLNTDPIKADYSPGVIMGLAIVLAIVVFFAAARFRRQTLFGFGHSTHIGNLAWHVFIVTGIVFICYLFFLSIVQMEVLAFGAAIFDGSCDKISQRDTSSSGRRWRRARSSSLPGICRCRRKPARRPRAGRQRSPRSSSAGSRPWSWSGTSSASQRPGTSACAGQRAPRGLLLAPCRKRPQSSRVMGCRNT
jgi:hypothetical protein